MPSAPVHPLGHEVFFFRYFHERFPRTGAPFSPTRFYDPWPGKSASQKQSGKPIFLPNSTGCSVKKAPNRRFPAPGAIIRTQGLMSVRPVVSRFSIPTPSTIPAADGPVFISRLMGTPSKRKKTAVWGWCVRRCCVPGAIRTSDMCLKMARIPPGCGIASIPRRSILKMMQSEWYVESAFAESPGWRR